MTCLHCDGPKRRKSYTYCSVQCQQDYQWAELKAEIEARGEILTYSKVGDGTVIGKRYLVETQGCQCLICKRKTWNGEAIPLIMDHIDGNSTNWKLKNLRLICPNCDALTPTYKGRNRGNGRHARRVRYAEGKSF